MFQDVTYIVLCASTTPTVMIVQMDITYKMLPAKVRIVVLFVLILSPNKQKIGVTYGKKSELTIRHKLHLFYPAVTQNVAAVLCLTFLSRGINGKPVVAHSPM